MIYKIVDFINYDKEILSPADMAGEHRYCIEFRIFGGTGMLNFHEVRKWLVEVYDWSDHVCDTRSKTDNPYWSWLVKMDSYRIYLKSDKELMMFKLKFPIGEVVE